MVCILQKLHLDFIRQGWRINLLLYLLVMMQTSTEVWTSKLKHMKHLFPTQGVIPTHMLEMDQRVCVHCPFTLLVFFKSGCTKGHRASRISSQVRVSVSGQHDLLRLHKAIRIMNCVSWTQSSI